MNHSSNIILVLVSATLFLTPLLTWEGFLFASTFTKTIFFITAVDVMLIFCLPNAPMRIKNYGHGLLSFFIATFFLIALIASFVGPDFVHSVWSNYERMFGLWTLGHIVLFFFIMATTLVRRDDWLWPMRAAVAGAFTSALVAIFEFAASGGAARVESTLRNASFLASYLLLASFLCLWLCVRSGAKRIESLLWGVCWFAIVAALVFTGSRGAMIALALSIIALLVLFIALAKSSEKTLNIRNNILKRYSLTALVLVLGVFVVGFLLRDRLAESSFDPISRLASISFSESTAFGRLFAWRVSWGGWRERFWLGWGVENYHLLFNKHYDPKLIDQEPWFDRAHNIFLDVGSTTGILGLLAYLGTVFSAIFLLARSWRKGEAGFWEFTLFSLTLIAHVIQGMFMFDFLMSLMLLFVIFAFINTQSVPNQALAAKLQDRRAWLRFGIAVPSVLALWYIGVFAPLQENRIAKAGYDSFVEKGDYVSGRRFIEQALAYDTYGNADVRRAVAEYVFEFIKQGGMADKEWKRSVIDYAIEKMEENIQEKPMDVKWYMYQGQLYNLGAVIFGEPNRDYAKKAELRFLEARALSPARPQIYLEIAQARKVLGDREGVWEAIDVVEKLIPEYSSIHLNALVHAIDLGDGAREILQQAWLDARGDYDFASVRDAYVRKQRFLDAAATEERIIKRLEKDSPDPQILAVEYKNLAVFYRDAGDYDRATKAAFRVIELDPRQKVSGEAFIESLRR